MIEAKCNFEKKIDIKISNNVALLNISNDIEEMQHKTVKLEDLIQAFQKFGLGVDTPILPRSTIRYRERGGKITLILAYPATKFTAVLQANIDGVETKFENCARPAILMCFELCKNEDNSFNLTNSNAYGIKEDLLLINLKTPVFNLPFPNIGEDGWICWGGNNVGSRFTSLMGLDSLINILFSSKFNSDLFNRNAFADLGISSPNDFFTYIQGKDIFPDGLFLHSGRRANFTIGDI